MSYHRKAASQPAPAARRPRALSHSAVLSENKPANPSPLTSQDANCTMPLLSSPIRTRRTLAPVNGNIMSTPPPNRVLSAELKMKGSLTDPAQPRRRDLFGNVRRIHPYRDLVLTDTVRAKRRQRPSLAGAQAWLLISSTTPPSTSLISTSTTLNTTTECRVPMTSSTSPFQWTSRLAPQTYSATPLVAPHPLPSQIHSMTTTSTLITL